MPLLQGFEQGGNRGLDCKPVSIEITYGLERLAMYLQDIYTISTNLAGLPGMSIPAGMIDNLPVGLQLIGNYFKESQMLNIAHAFQKETDWHTRMPDGVS